MDTLNTKKLKETYGLIIQTGLAKLLEYPERKEPISNDWQDQHGVEYQLNKVFFKDKEVTLNCAFMADTDVIFWKNYNAFFAEITKPGYQKLFIYDHGKTYDVFYKKTGTFEHLRKRLKNVERVFVKFELTLQVK
ncbi:hypothetical protein [Myroides odoratimimus]|uniref:hypothetical protein n=1 Tax=Myroides odoratimimus TaxID=76832 RepID=UPI00257701BA|nr:hypothetical protein [Myroides odoratimimus]MDM1093425.1 hypothetical protein [Myroides odoratimimus]